MDYTNAIDIQAQSTDAGASHIFCYGNAELLSSFASLMAEHGKPVCASTMLNNPKYARKQLRLACTMEDQALQQLAVKMLSALPQSTASRSPLDESTR